MSEFWFTSSLFQVEPGEDEETNPYRFGRQLAQWLITRLRSAGYSQVEAIAEDWGWCVMCERKPFDLWVGCSNVGREPYPDGAGLLPAASGIVWHCFVVAEPGLLQRVLKSVNPAEAVGKLSRELERILRGEPAITLVDQP